MKQLSLLLLLFLNTTILFSQDEQGIKVKLSKASEFENNGSFIEALLHDKEGNIYLIKNKPSGTIISMGGASMGRVGYKFYIEKYAPDLTRLVSKETGFPIDESMQKQKQGDWGSGLLGGLVINEEPYLFRTYYHKKTRTRYIHSIKINSDCTFEEPVLVQKIENTEKDQALSRFFEVHQSEDKSKFMIVGIPKAVYNRGSSYSVIVFNDQFVPLWEQQHLTLPIKEQYQEDRFPMIGNQGRFYLKTIQSRLTGKGKSVEFLYDDRTKGAVFLTYNKGDEDVRVIPFEFPHEKHRKFKLMPDSMDQKVTGYALFSFSKRSFSIFDPRNTREQGITEPHILISGISISEVDLENSTVNNSELLLDQATLDHFADAYWKDYRKQKKKDPEPDIFGPLIEERHNTFQGIKKIQYYKNGETKINIQAHSVLITILIEKDGNKVSEILIPYDQFNTRILNHSHFHYPLDKNIILTNVYENEQIIIKCHDLKKTGEQSATTILKNRKDEKKDYTLGYDSFISADQSIIFTVKKDKTYKLGKLILE